MRTAASSLVAVAAMASTVSAHARTWGNWLNGVDLGDSRSITIRSPPNNSPVKDLTSPDLICNVGGDKAVPEFVKAAGGDTLGFEWYHDNRHDDIIAESHKGPLITWITKYVEGLPTGGVWTKIAEEGYDGTSWAVDKIRANKGIQEFTLPASLAPGKYIVRQEIIALHESDTAYSANAARGAQFYPACHQIEVTSGGTAVPPGTFDFNKGYTYEDPGIVFNLYGSFTSYPIPGPDVWTGEGGGASPAPPAGTPTDDAPPAATPTKPAATSAAAPVATKPAAEAEAPAADAPAVPSPVFSSVPTTLATATRPEATQPADEPTYEAPAAPPSTCTRKRSLKARKARRAAAAKQARRVARAQF